MTKSNEWIGSLKLAADVLRSVGYHDNALIVTDIRNFIEDNADYFELDRNDDDDDGE